LSSRLTQPTSLHLPARFAATAAATTGPPTATTSAARAPAATTSAATASAEAVAAATSAAAKAALGLGPRFIDIQRAAIHRVSIERGDSLIRLSFVCHFDECETAGTAGIAIRHDAGAIHNTVPFKQAAHCLFGNVEIQVADEDVLHSSPPVKFESKAHRRGNTKRDAQDTLVPDSRKLSNALRLYHGLSGGGKWVSD
jgi:hypothetical protein